MGFPRFKKKGRDQDRVTFTTGACARCDKSKNSLVRRRGRRLSPA